MDLNAIVRALVDELAVQWAVDQAKKASIDDAFRYNMVVTAVNAAHDAGAFPPELDSESAWSIATGWTADRGYPGVAQILNNQELDWASYPIATYTPI